MEPLTPQHVQAALDGFGFDIEIRFFEQSTATSQMAADNIGCELGQIVKSIAFVVDGQAILVLTSGDQRVDDRLIAEKYAVGRKKVKIATPDELLAIYGYEPGSVPPLAHRQTLPTWIDNTLQRYDVVYAAGGAHNAIFPVTLEQLSTISGGTWADIVRLESAS